MKTTSYDKYTAMKRIVIKIGSNVLTRQDGILDMTRMSSIVDQVSVLLSNGYQVILVTSGAVACGRSMLADRHSAKLDAVQQRQLYSAVGQVKLIERYRQLFSNWGIIIGQILTMKENFATRREYLNQRACMEVMLANRVVPIVNENDTVSVTELMFTDNDELSGLVASMMDADTLLILSSIDGIYNGSPKDSSSQVIRKVMPDDDLGQFISREKSGFGRGGMITKSSIARKAADEGIRVIIANGLKNNIIQDIFLNPENVTFTEFVPRKEPISSVKKWIAHSNDFVKGCIRIDIDAVHALLGNNAVSLLPVGVTDVEGEFEEGDVIEIFGPGNHKIAVGKSAYSSAEARKVIGMHDCRPIVHYDYLYII